MDRQPVSVITSYQFNISFYVQYSLLLVISAFFLITGQVKASTEFKLPPGHKSSYSIEKYGTDVGNMYNELNLQNNQVQYISHTKATGFASLFVKNDLVETSVLNWFHKGATKTLQQQSYQLFRGEKHRKNQSISFDWSDAAAIKITGSYKNNTYTISSQQAVWGRHLLPLIMSNELQTDNKTTTNTFYITDKGGRQLYTYTLEKSETLAFSDKDYPVLKFSINREGSNRMSYIWLSREHYYLPLKIEQYKDGKLNVSMLITSFTTNNGTQQDRFEKEADYDD